MKYDFYLITGAVLTLETDATIEDIRETLAVVSRDYEPVSPQNAIIRKDAKITGIIRADQIAAIVLHAALPARLADGDGDIWRLGWDNLYRCVGYPEAQARSLEFIESRFGPIQELVD